MTSTILGKTEKLVNEGFSLPVVKKVSDRTWYIGFGVLVCVYALLPFLINQYNYPPGGDPITHQRSFNRFLSDEGTISKYYGYLFMVFTGGRVLAYYVLTPLLVYLGLIFYLRDRWMVFLAWLFLFLASPAIMINSTSGVWVETVGIFTLGLGSLYFFYRFLTSLANSRWAWLALVLCLGGIGFHTLAGSIIAVTMLSYLVLRLTFDKKFRVKWYWLIPFSLPFIGLVLTAYFLGSSGKSLTDFNSDYTGAIDKRMGLFQNPRIWLDTYIGIYFIGIIILTLGMIIYLKVMRMWGNDHKLNILAAGVFALVILGASGPIHDRPSRIAGSLLAICCAIIWVDFWKLCQHWQLKLVAVGVLIVTAVGSYDMLKYWVQWGGVYQ